MGLSPQDGRSSELLPEPADGQGHRRGRPTAPFLPSVFVFHPPFIQQTLPSACAVTGRPLLQAMPGQQGPWQSRAMRLGQLGRPEEAGPALQVAAQAVWG